MKNKKTLITLAVITVGILLGLLFGRTTVFSLMYLAAFTFISLLIFALTFVIRLFLKTKSNNFIKTTGLITFIGLTTLITSVITMRTIADRKSSYSEELIQQLENYRQKHEAYPKNLSDLNVKDDKGINYNTDTLRQNFTIHFLVDGWHYKTYDSKDNKWRSGD